jgi:iron(III) transport system substrate-binding protein
MRDQKMLAPFGFPLLEKYPADAKEKADGSLYFWASARESHIGFAYNKNSIPAAAVPKSYEDLLNPALKGKLALTTTDTGVRVTGALLRFKGEEFVKKLKAQEIRLHALSGRALLDLIVSGEVAASPSIFRSHSMVSIAKGAPVAWLPMEIVPTNSGGVAVSASATHPHAALLLAEFILSPEGQQILEKFELSSAVKDYGFKRWYPEKGLTTEQYEKENSRWEKTLRDLGRR